MSPSLRPTSSSEDRLDSKPSALVLGIPSFIQPDLEALRQKGHKIHIFDTAPYVSSKFGDGKGEVKVKVNGAGNGEGEGDEEGEKIPPFPRATKEGREAAYAAIRELVKRHRYEALLFMGGAFGLRPFGKEFFALFFDEDVDGEGEGEGEGGRVRVGGGLKIVAGMGAGFDAIDVDYLASHQVIYCNGPNAVADPTATTTLMLILQTIRQATEAEAFVKSGAWGRGVPRPGRTRDPRDVVIGIVGLGNIGKLVQKKVEALGVKVVYNNRHRLNPDEEGNATYLPFPTLLRTADLISLHVPLSEGTRHLLSDKEFEVMKEGVIIVNTSRGPVVDEEALVRALKSGKVSTVGLDVFEKEPVVHPYLLASNRATTLPHYGAATSRAWSDGEYEVLANFTKWLENGKGNSPVNVPAGGWPSNGHGRS